MDKSARERWQLVWKKKLCFNCQGPHYVRDCRSDPNCNVCKEQHHTLLYGSRERLEVSVDTKTDAAGENSKESVTRAEQDVGKISVACAVGIQTKSGSTQVRLKVLPVVVWNELTGRSCVTYGFLDEGSNTTLCTKELIERLGVKGKKIDYTLFTVSVQVSLLVRRVNEAQVVSLAEVIAVSSLPKLEDSIPRMQDVKKYSYLRGIEFPEVDSSKVELLIGAKVLAAHRIKNIRESSNGPVAVHTGLGWTLVGAVREIGESCDGSVQVHFCRAKNDVLHEQMQSLYDMEFKELEESGMLSFSI